MKNVLKGIEPERVMYYFEKMSNIVRGSSHEKPMSDYLVSFAEERGYDVWQDEVYNVFIKAPGAAGGEDADPVVLHGHMDMVWDKEDDIEHDFFNDPLDLYIEDGFIKARGTTLGADNGIGVAYMLALMENDDITHPPLECVITVMEELGKQGLKEFDSSKITADRMIDFNWIDDKQILVGCSGDVSYKITMPADWESAPEGMAPMTLKISGLKGGHCEWDIHMQRANSIKLIARIVKSIQEEFEVRIAQIEGGVQNNVIPSVASADILVKPDDKDEIETLCKNLTNTLEKEYEDADPDLSITLSEAEEYPENVFSKSTGEQLTKLIHLMPNGLLNINLKVDVDKKFNKVMETSGAFPTEMDNNLGILRTEGDEIWMITTITSAVTSRKHNLVDQIETIVELVDNGAEIEKFGVDAPEFPYNPESEMAEIVEQTYEEYYEYEPEREVNCCSLQLGMLIQAEDLDCVGIGTEIHAVHSPKERVKIESIQKTWEFTKKVMEKLSKK